MKNILPDVLDDATDRLNRHMPDLFGYSDIDEMTNDTAEKSKLIAPVIAKSLEFIASRETPEYVREETNGYDNLIYSLEIENKFTLTSCASSFATANNHSKTKVPLVLCVKVKNVFNHFHQFPHFWLIALSLRIQDLDSLMVLQRLVRITMDFRNFMCIGMILMQ